MDSSAGGDLRSQGTGGQNPRVINTNGGVKTSIVYALTTLLCILCCTFRIATGFEAVGPTIAPPIAGLRQSDLSDTFDQMRDGYRHGAIDIVMPENTPVLAVSNGLIRKLFLSKAGGNTIYEFDDAGTYCYYYAHLDHYGQGVRDGVHVSKGEVIGYVGSSGDAPLLTPHLHFEIHLLDPKRWWQGIAIDPYPVLVEAVQCTLRNVRRCKKQPDPFATGNFEKRSPARISVQLSPKKRGRTELSSGISGPLKRTSGMRDGS
jgi:murein DD-endopeptidase MepM/ murein hydrolase activator NlpD